MHDPTNDSLHVKPAWLCFSSHSSRWADDESIDADDENGSLHDSFLYDPRDEPVPSFSAHSKANRDHDGFMVCNTGIPYSLFEDEEWDNYELIEGGAPLPSPGEQLRRMQYRGRSEGLSSGLSIGTNHATYRGNFSAIMEEEVDEDEPDSQQAEDDGVQGSEEQGKVNSDERSHDNHKQKQNTDKSNEQHKHKKASQ